MLKQFAFSFHQEEECAGKLVRVAEESVDRLEDVIQQIQQELGGSGGVSEKLEDLKIEVKAVDGELI